MKERSDVTSGDKPIEQTLSIDEMKKRIAETEAAGTGIGRQNRKTGIYCTLENIQTGP